MNLTKKLTPVALATAMAFGGMAAPSVASAEVSASLGIASFYLWRGQDISNGQAVVSGSIDYSHDSGVYAGIWTSSEDAGSETDLYIGYSGEVGGFGYDVSFWDYLYPSNDAVANNKSTLSDTNGSELAISLSYADFSVAAYMGNDLIGGTNDYVYYTVGYSTGPYSLTYGTWDYDKANTSTQDGESHLTFSYAYNDNLTFTVSKGDQGSNTGTGGTPSPTYDEDPLFHVAYSFPIK